MNMHAPYAFLSIKVFRLSTVNWVSVRMTTFRSGDSISPIKELNVAVCDPKTLPFLWYADS